MKINTNANVTQTGSVDTSKAKPMGFDEAGMGVLAGLLQNMYSDTSLAVLREYFCNAIDSHRAAGTTRPVEVTLPADMNPSLLIQDFGLGLSEQELCTIFSTYGLSTKRNSNDSIGGFGIGSKAAFSMTDQFIVTGVKNGEKTVVHCSLGDAGMGETNTVFHAFDSTEPNGVTVSIPIRDVAAMERTAAAFFTTWQPGTVLVDGEQPASIFDGAFAVGDRFHVVTGKKAAGTASHGLTLVMGGVGYPVDPAIQTLAAGENSQIKNVISHLPTPIGSPTGQHLLIDARVGDADITPSREALRDTDRTVEFVRDALVEFAASVRTRVMDHVAEAPTFHEAARRLFSADGVVQFIKWEERALITWNGRKVERSVTVPAYLCAQLEQKTDSYGYPNGKSAVRSTDKLELRFEDLDSVLVVTGVTTDRQWGLIKRKFKAYQTLENHPARTVVVGTIRDTQSSAWLTWGGTEATVETISYDQYAARVKNAVIVPAGERGRFTYAAASTLAEASTSHGSGLENLPLAELREATELIWIYENRLAGMIAQQVAAEHPDATWIVLTGNQSGSALTKRLPEAVHLDKLVNARANEIIASASEDVKTELLASHLSHQIGSSYQVDCLLTHLSPLVGRVTNPRFTAILAELNAARHRPALSEAATSVASALGILQTNAGTAFGDPNAMPLPADKALRAEFPIAAMVASSLTQSGYLSETIKTAKDQLVAHLNSLTASI